MARIENDAFFTPDNVALACVEDFYKELPQYKDNEIVEPSAGGGAFLRAFEKLGLSYEAYDLNPQANNIVQADYLTTDIDLTNKIVLGNPPYGHRSNLSKAFIKRSFEQGAEAVGFLLFGGILGHYQLYRIGYKIEYFKRLEYVNFVDKDGQVVLKTGNAFNAVFVVWVNEPFQKTEECFIEYGDEQCWDYYSDASGLVERTNENVQRYPGNNKKWYRINNSKTVSYLFKVKETFNHDMYKSVMWMYIGGRVPMDTVNFYASYPELNRSWIDVVEKDSVIV